MPLHQEGGRDLWAQRSHGCRDPWAQRSLGEERYLLSVSAEMGLRILGGERDLLRVSAEIDLLGMSAEIGLRITLEATLPNSGVVQIEWF